MWSCRNVISSKLDTQSLPRIHWGSRKVKTFSFSSLCLRIYASDRGNPFKYSPRHVQTGVFFFYFSYCAKASSSSCIYLVYLLVYHSLVHIICSSKSPGLRGNSVLVCMTMTRQLRSTLIWNVRFIYFHQDAFVV